MKGLPHLSRGAGGADDDGIELENLGLNDRTVLTYEASQSVADRIRKEGLSHRKGWPCLRSKRFANCIRNAYEGP